MHKTEDISSYFFWFFIVFYLDPGGILIARIENSILRTVVFTVLYGIAFVIFLYKKRHGVFDNLKIPIIKPYIIIMLFWNLYYYIVYLWINNSQFEGFAKILTSHLDMILKTIIVIPIIYFATYSLKPFMKILVYSTILIGLAFILSVFTGVEIINTASAKRGLGNLHRYFMDGYGLIYFLIPITISFLLLRKIQMNVFLAGIIAVVIIFLTVMRREMVGIVESLTIISLLITYMYKSRLYKAIVKVINFKSMSIAIIAIVMLYVFSPKVIDSVVLLGENILNELGIGNSQENVRMQLNSSSKMGIMNSIRNNIYFGTGYISDWYTGAGGKNQLEGSDYVFLACIGMYGVVGLLIFLPFYFYILSVIRTVMKFVRNNINIIYNLKCSFWLPLVVILSAATEFLKNIIEYPNWFFPIGAITSSAKFFIFLGLLIGAYYNLKVRVDQVDSVV